MRDMDQQALVRRDGRGKRVQDVGKGRQGAVAELIACMMYVLLVSMLERCVMGQ